MKFGVESERPRTIGGSTPAPNCETLLRPYGDVAAIVFGKNLDRVAVLREPGRICKDLRARRGA
jgi:hypothetical protein